MVRDKRAMMKHAMKVAALRLAANIARTQKAVKDSSKLERQADDICEESDTEGSERQ